MPCHTCRVCVTKGFDGGILISCLSLTTFSAGKPEHGDDNDEDVVEVEEPYKKKGQLFALTVNLLSV